MSHSIPNATGRHREDVLSSRKDRPRSTAVARRPKTRKGNSPRADALTHCVLSLLCRTLLFATMFLTAARSSEQYRAARPGAQRAAPAEGRPGGIQIPCKAWTPTLGHGPNWF